MLSKKRLAKTLLVFIILGSHVANSSCPNATYLGVGDTVKDCPRIGLSVEYDLQIRKDLIEGDYNKKILEEKDKLLIIKDTKIKYLEDQYDLWKNEAAREREEYDKIRKNQNSDFWYGIMLGAGSILMGAWAIKQVGK